MTTLNVPDDAPVPGKANSLLSSYLYLKAGGPDAGSVWVINPAGSKRPATDNEIAAAQAGVTGFSAARSACQSIEDADD